MKRIALFAVLLATRTLAQDVDPGIVATNKMMTGNGYGWNEFACATNELMHPSWWLGQAIATNYIRTPDEQASCMSSNQACETVGALAKAGWICVVYGHQWRDGVPSGYECITGVKHARWCPICKRVEMDWVMK